MNLFAENSDTANGQNNMSKAASSHSQFSKSPLDDNSDGSPGSSLHPLLSDLSNPFGAAGLDINGTFNGPHPSLVLYSSDVNIPSGHPAEIVTIAGSGAGSSSGGATTTLGSTLVKSASGTGLSFNLTWDSSVSTAPAGFTTVIQNVAQYYANHFSDPVTGES
jgi:hypothetical protein